jgi:hypothetical protein
LAIYYIAIVVTINLLSLGAIAIYVRRISMATSGTPQDVLDLQAAVAQEATVEGSAIVLLQNLSAQLTAALASGNPTAAVEAVVTTMNTNQTALAAAVAANTPAAPASNAAKS